VSQILQLAPKNARGASNQSAVPVSAAHVSREPRYFWGRPSPRSDLLYYCADCGSDELQRNAAMTEIVERHVRALREADPGNRAAIPYALITASGTILDPYISPAAAEYQIGRVAKARGLDEEAVRALVADATERPLFGLFGEARVDVLMLNVALDNASDRRGK
jgi:K+-transporting ATPase ATPase C chain